uniref:Reverse transcriptase domain-containing protein n=1 Tax=Cannabis sativa TaxID=3483 RepID=A0A803P4Q5_CANSA
MLVKARFRDPLARRWRLRRNRAGIQTLHHLPMSAKKTWETFTNGKAMNRDQKLLFTEPMIRNGIKIAQVDLEEVREQGNCWKSAVICKVLGSNPPVPIFKGFIKRVWDIWGSTKCSSCSKFGHTKATCRHAKIQKEREEKQLQQVQKKQKEIKETMEKASNSSQQKKEWIIPKKTATQRQKNQATIGEKINPMSITFVYGLNTGEERKGMWVNLLTEGGNDVTINETVDATNWLVQIHNERLLKTRSDFSWTNNQDGDKRIYSKINHSFVNEDWNDRFPLTKAHYSWETILDHCACVISMAIDEKIVGKPFRYYNFWADHPEFKQAVLESWQKPVRVVGMKALSHKLLRLKHVMKKLNREVIRDIGRRYYESKALFLIARMQAQAHAQDLNFQQEEKEAPTNFINHEKLYHSFLRQRSKVTWLSKGVENNAYFHASLKKRRMENSIISFTNEQGVVIDNFYEVVDHYIGHFQLYMGTESRPTASLKTGCMEMGNCLNLEQQLSLIRPFTKKEIRKAFFTISDVKSPGPDCYGAGFFKKMWPELGSDFTHAVEIFFTTGSMPQEFHATMLTLILKTENPTKAVDYRPIACCTTIYKCVSKLICMRLPQVLPLIVNQNQGAFVQGRSIAHNVIILQDILKNYKRKNISPRCTLKVDISKAYDTVSWEFLEALLNTYKMPSRFIKWIMSCMRATTYSIMMNGRVQGSFKGKKGLRQGDPLSPLLFVLIMKYLTRRLIMVANQSKFKYNPMCKSLKIISLYFAADLMLFSKGSLSSLQVIKSVLNEFEAASGLAINANKSQLYFGGVKAEEKQAMLREMNLLEGVYPLKYLGVPLRPTKWKAEDCGVIIKKIKQRLHTWATRHLSFAGFKDGVKWNQAILAKYIWAISTKSDILWVKWVNNIYLKNNFIWTYDLKNDASWYWRKPFHLREKFTPHELTNAGDAKGRLKTKKLYNSKLYHTIFEISSSIRSSVIVPKHRLVGLMMRPTATYFLLAVSLSRFSLGFAIGLGQPIGQVTFKSGKDG